MGLDPSNYTPLELLSLVIHKRAYRTGNMDPHVWPNCADSAQYSQYNRQVPLFCYGLIDHSFLSDSYRDLRQACPSSIETL
jgi:hypothetical protein